MKTRRVLCAIGWHTWSRTRRVGSLLRRRCRVCGYREMRFDRSDHPVVEPKGTRIPRTPLEIVTNEEMPSPLPGQPLPGESPEHPA